MIWLIAGVLLWSGSHYFKRLAPDARASLGNAGKGLVAVLNITAIVLMVIGYKAAPFTMLWDFGDWAVRVNNLLMIFAVVLFGAGKSKSRLRGRIRHSALAGLLVWVVAHLLVNGDLASVVLFGGLGLWAIGMMMLINRAEPDYAPWPNGTVKGDIRLAVIAVVVFAVISAIHVWIGPSPFGG